MTKQKKNAQIGRVNRPQRVNQRTARVNEPLAPATQPIVSRRQISDLSLFFRRQESISPPTVQQRFSVQHFIKSTSIEVLVLQCTGLKSVIDKINAKISVERNLLYSVVEKYLHGLKHQLWCDKYRPLALSESLHLQMGERIKSWLRVFYSYRNTVFEQSNSFIDDYFGDNSNNIEFKLLKQYGWRLKGLIIKGRDGVGKSTAIRCTAKQMQYEILSCGNECNQIKFLKEKNQATQSQCVRVRVNRNQTQIQRTNRSITTFAVQRQQSQHETQQSKRIQLMHNVGQFYPREDQSKFFSQLNKTIQSSKIPFIMTMNGQDVPQHLKIYDVIEFEQAKTEDIAMLLYLIYHIEVAFSKCIDMEKIIQKDKFKQLFNEQLAKFQFEIYTPFIDFIKLTETFNKKLSSLFTFVQNSNMYATLGCHSSYHNKLSIKQVQKHYVEMIDLGSAQIMMKQYLKRATQEELMSDYFLVQNHNRMRQDQTSKDSLTSSTVQLSKYLIDTSLSEQKKSLDSVQIPTLVSTPQKKEFQNHIVQNIYSKTKTNAKQQLQPQQSPHEQQQQQQQQPSLHSYINALQMRVISDYNHEIKSDQCFIFNKLYNQSRYQQQELEQKTIYNIPMQRHKAIRKHILNNVKKEYYLQNQMNTTIRANQINYLGFLIDSRSRVSRKKINKQQLNLKKFLKTNEINYLKTFTHFIKPNSTENIK